MDTIGAVRTRDTEACARRACGIEFHAASHVSLTHSSPVARIAGYVQRDHPAVSAVLRPSPAMARSERAASTGLLSAYRPYPHLMLSNKTAFTYIDTLFRDMLRKREKFRIIFPGAYSPRRSFCVLFRVPGLKPCKKCCILKKRTADEARLPESSASTECAA